MPDFNDTSCRIYHADDSDKKKFEPKYYIRIPLGKKEYRYFYSKKAYDAYLKNKKKNSDEKKKTTTNKVEKALSKTKFSFNKKSSNETNKTLASLVEKGRKLIEKVTKKTKTSVEKETTSFNKEVEKTESSNNSAKKLFSDLAEKGKKAVSKVMDKLGETSINAVKVSEVVKDVAKKAVSWLSGGVLKMAVDEVVNKVKEKKQEREKAETERKAAEEAEKKKKEQEEYEKWRQQKDAEMEESRRKLQEKKEREAAEKREKELSKQQAAIDELLESGDTLPGLDIKDEPCTKEEDQEAVNPYYDGTDNYGYSQNCAYCTAAYELRQRGYDVEASEASYSTANTLDVICDWYDGEEVKTLLDVFEENNVNPSKGATYTKAADMIEDDLAEHGDGARGQFLFYWSNGGGHSVVWEVQGDDVVLRDCQNNEILEVLDYLQYANNVAYFRTDNVELSDKIVETVTNTDESRYVEDHW